MLLLPYRWCGAAVVAWLIWVLRRRALELRGGARGAAFLTWVWPAVIAVMAIALIIAPIKLMAHRASG